MPVLCNVEGKLVPPEQALVPVLDRGFLYGDSVYEVVRTYAGRPFELDRHLARMERTSERIDLTLPPRETLLRELQRTLDAAGNPESYARIVVTDACRRMRCTRCASTPARSMSVAAVWRRSWKRIGRGTALGHSFAPHVGQRRTSASLCFSTYGVPRLLQRRQECS